MTRSRSTMLRMVGLWVMMIVVLPFVAYALDLPGHTVAALAGAGVIILFAHRERIRKAFAGVSHRKEA